MENPSRRGRSDPYPGLISRPDRSTPIGPNHTVPYGTVPVFAWIPGNELPGLRRAQSSPYDHLVPPGQSLTSPYRTKFDGVCWDANTLNQTNHLHFALLRYRLGVVIPRHAIQSPDHHRSHSPLRLCARVSVAPSLPNPYIPI